MKVYAFDVDETLEISNGPVLLQSLMDLRTEGHIVGICGNWAAFCQRVAGWQHLVSFISACQPFQDNTGRWCQKEWFLGEIKRWIAADEYIMVGNIPGQKNSLGHVCASDDMEAAQRAGWRFIKEDDFAAGTR